MSLCKKLNSLWNNEGWYKWCEDFFFDFFDVL